MKILKLVASVVLLSVLAVSTATAATALVGGSTYSDGATYNGNGTTFSDEYEFTLSGGLDVLTSISFTTGDTTFADLLFTWTTGGTYVNSIQLTDSSGVASSASSFTTALLAANSPYILTVTGSVLGDTTPATYSFSIKASAVPVPAAFWLFGSALIGFIGLGRRKLA